MVVAKNRLIRPKVLIQGDTDILLSVSDKLRSLGIPHCIRENAKGWTLFVSSDKIHEATKSISNSQEEVSQRISA